MTRQSTLVLLLVSAAYACGGEPAPSGYGEPVRVPGGSFKEGDLDDVASAVDDDGPRVTAITTAANVVRPRQAGIAISGRTSGEAYSVAIRLTGLGSGWWVVPVGAEDLVAPGELGWNLTLELGDELEPGEHRLDAVAIDGEGVAGPRSGVRLCVVQGVDTTRNACDSTVQPPADSNAGCTIDSIRRESVVWRTAAEPGQYLVYANLFEACGKQAVHFTLEAFVRTEGDEPDTFGFERLGDPIYGVVLGASANGGKQTGLYVGAIDFP